ncbi:unnamed protein product [Jaminaea pallidilutea]
MAPGLNLPPPAASGKGATVEDVDETSVASSSKPKFSTGGLIYPPPDLRSIVDKTAAFVARNGASFEAKIKGDERANTKFAFLNDGDAYNGYYRAKIEAVRDGTGPLAATSDGQNQLPPTKGEAEAMLDDKGNDEPGEDSSSAPPEPRPFLFSADLPNITAVDLDILKLTALFVAERGKAFSQALLEREANSYQFEFLRPTHSLFGFFNRLVEQYRLVLSPPPELLEQVKSYAQSEGSHGKQVGMGAGGPRQVILKEARQRAEWNKWMEERRKKRADDEEQDKAAFAEIDWQDFVVVSTVEVTEADAHIDLPVPMSLREVESMTMAQKRMASMIMEEEAVDEDEAVQKVGLVDLPGASHGRPAAGGNDDDAGGDEMQMDESSDEEEKAAPAPPLPQQEIKKAPPPPSNIKVRRDYVPQTLAQRQAASAQQMTKCPVCGESIATSEMDEHVRIELLNPKYREQRADIEARKAQQAALTQGADPSRFLRNFAGARRDIFGLQEQEDNLAQREEEEKRKAKERERLVWDGRAAHRLKGTDMSVRPRTEQEEANERDLQSRFKPKDTESIGPQARPGETASPYPPPPDPQQQQQQQQQQSEPEHVVGPDGSSAPVSYNTAGQKRPAPTGFAQQGPSQRVGYEGANGYPSPAPPAGPSAMYAGSPAPQPPTGPRGPMPPGYGAPPQAPGQGGWSDPTSSGPPPSNTTHLTLILPTTSHQGKHVQYRDLPLHSTTVASIRDRLAAQEFPDLGVSRIKLRLVKTGKVMNLKQTLAEVGVAPAAAASAAESEDAGDEIEVMVK